MLIQQKLGNINSTAIDCKKNIDWLELEWYETSKRILHKKTISGKEVVMKFLKENQNLTQGDIIYQDADSIISINICACEVIVFRPKTMYEMAAVCYEIGNKHIPLFFEDDELLIAYEAPIFNLLVFAGYAVEKQHRKLTHPLKTSVTSHAHFSSDILLSTLKAST